MKEKKVALVTGASRGIGLAIATQLRRDGLHVVGTATDESHFNSSCDDWVCLDFLDPNSVENSVQQVADLRVDVLINNAGINIIKPFEEQDLNDFQRVFDVNVFGAVKLCQILVPDMAAAEWGRVVNIASIWSVISRAGRSPYSSAKSALAGFTRALAVEYASNNVLINSVSPGFIETDLTKKSLSEEEIEELKTRIPARRLGSPEEIANLVSWLASPKNGYLTGQNLVSDGGFVSV